ncbi:MAG: hypothetical protein WCH34_10400 [Bacteroidota bacterium]
MADNLSANTVSSRRYFNFKGSIFIICLLISFFSWFFIRYAHDITITSTYSVDFVYPYTDRILVNSPDNQLYLQIKSNGLQLILKQLFSSNQKLQVRLKRSNLDDNIQKGISNLTSAEIINQVSTQLGIPFSNIQMTRDTLSFILEKAISAKLPVRPNVSLDFATSYYLHGKVKTIPDSVEVIATSSVLQKTHFIETENITFSNLNSSKKAILSLIKPNSHCIIPDQTVDVQIPVEKYTETNYKVSVACDTTHLKLKFFPSQVNVKCLVAFKDFKTITPDMFTLVVNNDALNNKSHQKIKLKLTHFPAEVKVLYIEPSYVDYIILK